MIQLSQQLYFTDGSDRKSFSFILQSDLLQGHKFI